MSTLSFPDFIRTRRALDNPRGDFIIDTKAQMASGEIPDVATPGALINWMHCVGHPCAEAIREARIVWREYERECRKGLQS